METQRPEKKRRFLDDLADGVRQRLPGDADSELVDKLVRAAFDGVSIDDLRLVGLESMVGIALSIWDLMREREPDQQQVRVFNPQDGELAWAVDRTVVEVATRDMPFLVDSFAGELARQSLYIHLAVHPQIATRRAASGRLLDVLPLGSSGEGVSHESVMHYHLDLVPGQVERVELETSLRKVLIDVEAAVSDWERMRTVCRDAAERLVATAPDSVDQADLQETEAFLRWIHDDHFTFLGTLEYACEREKGDLYLRPEETGLGLWSQVPLQERATASQPLTPGARRFLEGPELVMITKTSQHATVHRNVHMDIISLKRFGDDGSVTGELRFVGLFTSMAYSIAARNIPMVRRKVAQVIERTRFLPASHNVKVLRHIVENYPRDELFQISEEDLYLFALRILELQVRPRLALLVRRDEEERFVSCMVYLPRDQHSTEMRIKIQRILELALGGEVTSYYTRISERPLAQLQFYIRTVPGEIPDIDYERIEARLAEAIKTWDEQMRDALTGTADERLATARRRYEEAFSPAYREYSSVQDAVADIPLIDAVVESGGLEMRLYRRGTLGRRFRLRTFERAAMLPLSNFLPMLENMGLEVISDYPSEVQPAGSLHPVWIRDFEVLPSRSVELDEVSARHFEETLRSLYSGDLENDGFNRLVLGAGLDCRQVTLLRAYCKYLRQTGIAFSQTYMEQTLASNVGIAQALIDLFEALFDPRRERDAERVEEIAEQIGESLESVASLDQDRILRRFLNLVQSTLRTNYFQPEDDGQPKSYLSLKLDGLAVDGLPSPRPRYEIFVYSPRFEAVHLRGGKVARGGIRWSGRREDFRTEILGLVKSQMVKNAVIVPVGAKGGFVLKRPPAESNALWDEGRACYRMMMRGLLDVTDDLDGSTVVPPRDVVRRDDDDTYLVVAADKGTATFSDLANSVAAEYGFWLGDAFASGGSKGYDHKKMGITARGAWESVKRHFRELGRDIQRETFTCIGVGDMSGDVFGNGMLLSEQTRLVAAFNHLHVFVDPDPDPQRSLTERRRLFELERSTWDDYDREALSPGGAIFDRSAKRLDVSPQIAEFLGLRDATVTPAQLIRAILLAKVDLLWFGGIGTYVKCSTESDAAVGDRANEEVRVDGCDLSCLVIGEGANLGATQRGRIEFALSGGKVNTDFIDNSGGVDCSDHEVNIKIALDAAVRDGAIDGEARDGLLVEMTDQVAQLVLRDNYLQSQAITLIDTLGAESVTEQARLMRELERLGKLDRRLEVLPDEATLAERRQAKRGLTRPEISVLLAYSKIHVYEELLDSDLPEDPALVRDLTRYFPTRMREPFAEAIASHRLRREIIATHVTNSMVNRVGATFVSRLAEEAGRPISDVARAYTAGRDIFDLRSLWQDVEALDNEIPADLQTQMLLGSVRMLGVVVRWLLHNGERPFDVATATERYEANIVTVAAQLDELLPTYARARVRRKEKSLRSHGVFDELASRVALFETLPAACAVAQSARRANVSVERVGKVYFTVGERFGFDRLRRAGEQLGGDSAYLRAATTATLDDLARHQARITEQVVKFPGRARPAINAWAQTRPDQVERLERLREDFEAASTLDLAMLTVAEREMRRVVEP
ncbi:MAG: NAD-glutamate dehydrogenase [Acidobacteriota bacterium]